MEKNDLNLSDFEKKKVSKLPDFYDKFQQVASSQEYRRFLTFSYSHI
jgi:hypothetical protein